MTANMMGRLASQLASGQVHDGSHGRTDEMDLETDSKDLSRNSIWCALVFRMLCWLLLHNFDRKDVQISKSEYLGGRRPVYVA